MRVIDIALWVLGVCRFVMTGIGHLIIWHDLSGVVVRTTANGGLKLRRRKYGDNIGRDFGTGRRDYWFAGEIMIEW